VKGHIMAKQTINIGSSANPGSGDPLRTAFDKVNDNFGELYAVSGAGSGQNIAISGQKIISENTNGNIQLDPNGTGEVQFLSDTTMGDSFKHQMGDGDDFKIYHDGSHSYISDEGTGNLNLQADNNINILNNAGTEFKAQFITNGAVNLFYDNSKKFETVTAGVDITGDLNVDTINTGGQALSVGGTATFTNATVTTTLAAGLLVVDSNISLNGNKLFTQLSNSDIDLDPAGTATVNLRVPEQTTVGSAGGASAVPASPTKYIKIKVNGTEYVIPAFAVS